MIDTSLMKSDEERDFYQWLLELKKIGWVSKIAYEPHSFILADAVKIKFIQQLKTKQKIKTKTLLRAHTYTPDFRFVLTKSVNFFFPNVGEVFVDTKGTFNRFKSNREFSINQKWMYVKYGIYVNKIVPKQLFKKSFVPLACRGITGRRFLGLPDLNEFLGKRK